MSVIYQNAKVKKSDFYTWFIQKYKDAGWTDISSNPTTDYQMLFSTGEDGNKELYINFRENDNDGIFSSSAGRIIDVRLPKKYTPNATAGTAGTLDRTSAMWFRCSIVGTINQAADSTLNVWYYVNKNYGAFMLEGNGGYNNPSTFLFVGKPDVELKGETLYSGPLVICTDMYGSPSGNGYAVSVDDPYLTSTSEIRLNTYFNDYPGALSVTSNKFCSDIVLGDTNGYRFKLDDSIVIIDAVNVSTPTNYMINGNKYRFFYTNSTLSNWLNSFFGYCIGLRIE